MYVEYISENNGFFTKGRLYSARREGDTIWCEDDDNWNHDCSIEWFNENFKEINKNTESSIEDGDKKRSPYYIGNGLYQVMYKKSDDSFKSNNFVGVCENFNPNGLCAFWDNINEKMLLVDYANILGVYPIE